MPKGRSRAELGTTIIAIIVVGAMVVFASLGRTSDPDVYWHMAVAREALATHSTIPRDPFSFSFAGAPWSHKDFLAEIIIYGLFRAFGHAGFAALKVVCAASLVGALAAMPTKQLRTGLGLLLVGGLTLTSFWFLEQPNIFSILLFGVTLALVERARQSCEATDSVTLVRAFAPLLAVTWVWTCLHRFALLGHAILLVFAIESLLSRVRLSPWVRRIVGPPVSSRFAGAAAIAGFASPVLGLANPTGVNVFRSIGTMAGHPELRQEFFEWKHLSPAEVFDVFPVACCVTIATATWVLTEIVRAARNGHPTSIRAWHAMLVVGASAMTMWSVRWLPFMAVAALATLAIILGDAFATTAWYSAAARRPMLIAVLAACAGTALFVRLREQQGAESLSLGEDPNFFPRAAVDFARDHGLSGNVVNAFDFGGYLMYWAWPATRVLVDGRNETVYPAQFVVRALLAEHDPKAFDTMRAADGATWAMGTNFPGKPGFGFLAKNPDWSLVYWSETAAVYTRRDVHGELESLRYAFIDPLRLEQSVVDAVLRANGDSGTLVAIQREIDRMLVDSPNSFRALTLLALFHSLLGPSHLKARSAALERLLRIGRNDPRAMQMASTITGFPLTQ